jgi:hypothetical protein
MTSKPDSNRKNEPNEGKGTGTPGSSKSNPERNPGHEEKAPGRNPAPTRPADETGRNPKDQGDSEDDLGRGPSDRKR